MPSFLHLLSTRPPSHPSRLSQSSKLSSLCHTAGPTSYLLYTCSVSCIVASNFLGPHGLYPTRLLYPWDAPDKNTGVSSHSLFQWILPTQGSNLGLLHCRQILYCLSHEGSPLGGGRGGGGGGEAANRNRPRLRIEGKLSGR